MKLENQPAVAILPLGTGNDLGRTLGWGGGYNNESMEAFIKKVIYGKEVQLDRWTIHTKPSNLNNSSNSVNNQNNNSNSNHSADSSPTNDIKPSAEVKKELPLKVLNNYFSIGADAKIALDFHSARGKFKCKNSFLANKSNLNKDYCF
jgi:diacylglycerol kinase (ATP)